MIHSLARLLVFIACFIGLSHAADKAQGERDEVLYLHCFRPTYGQKIVLDPDAAKDKTPATPPSRLVTLKVHVGRPFEVIGSTMHHVSGVITTEDGSYLVTLGGVFGSGFKFSGKIELEKAFDPDITGFSGAVFPCRCVFSKRKDIAPFLKAQAESDAKKLQLATELTRKNKELSEEPRNEQSGVDQAIPVPGSKPKGKE